jgi:hypothetical protein
VAYLGLSVEAQSKLTCRGIVIEVLDPHRPGCRLDDVLGQDAVLERGVVDLHAAYAAIASRMSSDRDLCSRAALSAFRRMQRVAPTRSVEA